jgi:SSS family solute:Na+ symporter
MHAPANALALAILIAVEAAGGDFPRSLDAFLGATPVLDGVIAVGEYDDASPFDGPNGWISQFSPVTRATDLRFRGWLKHDGRRLYLAMLIHDDVLYGIDTQRWLPDNNSKAHELTREGWPWFGDEIELLIHSGPSGPTGPAWREGQMAAGNGMSWQMVVNLTKARRGGIGVGGLLEGEPRSDERAWNTYRRWIDTGAMEAVAKPLPGGGGYVIEWAVNFNPCLEIDSGVFYQPSLGDRRFGLNIAVGDLDSKEAGAGNFGNFHHEDWFAGARDVRTQLRYWGTLWIRTSPKPPAPPPK